MKTHKRPIILGLICTAIASALYTSVIKLTTTATDAIINIGAGVKLHSPLGDLQVVHEQRNLELTCLIVVSVFGVRYFLVRAQINFLGQASNSLAADLRTRLFSRLLRLPISFFNDRRSGEIQSVLNNDVNVYQNAIGIIRDAIDGPIKAIGAFIAILTMQPILALVAFALIPVMGLAINRNSKRMKLAQSEVQQDLAELGGTTQEVLQGTRVVKAFGAEERTEQEYSRLIDKSYRSQMRSINLFASLRPLVELIGTFALALLLLVAGYLAAANRLSAAHIVGIALAMDVINQGWRSLASLSNTSASVSAASDRIYGLVLDVPEEKVVSSSSKTVSIIQGRVEFENVSFTYPDGTVALTDISFVLEPGESLALVGPSGAGKSTIADLLLRFYEPTNGRILFDGIDVKELDIAFIRSLIGVVPQHIFLFAGTIEDNVRVGRPDATDAEIAESISSAHATGFVADMSNRSSSELGERGTRLSGGQMQRVAIARALVRKPTILLLDEATSALDAESEKAVTEALVEVMHQRTTLMIAHRLTTAARADKIIYMKAGRAVEEGSHRELMERNGEYAALFRIFSGGILETAFV